MALTNNQTVLDWIDEMAAMTQPEHIVWIDGSDAQMEELRAQGYAGPAGIEYAILETNGQLSILPWEREKPPTQSQLGLEAEETGLPLVLISDGKLLAQNLTARGYDGVWLQKQLSKHGLQEPDQVFLMTVDEVGGVYLAPRSEQEEGRRA